ncbi:polysaccharide pyruvyl transferase family protein [Pseudomonas sp. SIMBA_077]
MKIGLITIHNSCNYGAVLQTFATQETLKKYGRVEIINYQNIHTDKTTKLVRFGFKPKDTLRLGKDLLKILPKIRILNKFKSFFSNHYKLSGVPTQNLRALEKKYDVFVCGSDQIWNPKIISENGTIDTNYFLEFVSTGKKISYASSMGSHSYTKKEQETICSYLKTFHRVSVRESDSADYLRKVLARPVDHVLDPTLLLNKEEWCKSLNIKKDDSKKPYILVYVLLKNKVLTETVKAVAEKLGLNVIAIDQNPFTTMHCTTHINDAGPSQFIELYSNAAFVVTNSFHGCAFSINFNIPFLITPPPTGLNRIMSLLKAVGAESRAINSKEEAIKIIDQGLDFNSINSKLNVLRSESKRYISEALESDS